MSTIAQKHLPKPHKSPKRVHSVDHIFETFSIQFVCCSNTLRNRDTLEDKHATTDYRMYPAIRSINSFWRRKPLTGKFSHYGLDYKGVSNRQRFLPQENERLFHLHEVNVQFNFH